MVWAVWAIKHEGAGGRWRDWADPGCPHQTLIRLNKLIGGNVETITAVGPPWSGPGPRPGPRPAPPRPAQVFVTISK